MRAFLVVAALWANVGPVRAADGPIGPWIAKHLKSASQKCAAGKVWLDNWASRTQEVIFEVHVFSLADEAADEIRFLTADQGSLRAGVTIVRPERLTQVRSIIPRIVDAGHARPEAEHTVAAAVGRSAMAVRYVKHPMTYISAQGVLRTGITRAAAGDMITLVPDVVSLSSTQIHVEIRGAPLQPMLAPAFRPTSRQPATSSVRGTLHPEESLLILRDPIAQDPVPAPADAVSGAVEQPDVEKPRATLFIITPRRALRGALAPNNPANQPQIFRF